MKIVLRSFYLGLLVLFGCASASYYTKTKVKSQDQVVVKMGPVSKADLKVPGLECASIGGDKNCTAVYDMNQGITAESAIDFMLWLELAGQAHVKNAVIHITSPGGDLYWGRKMIRSMEDSDIDTYCVADFEVASMAFAILESCGHRLMTKRTFLMTHEPKAVFVKDITENQTESGNTQAYINITVSSYNEMIVQHLNLTMTEYLDKINDGKDWFMDTKAALRYGAIDSVVPSFKAVTEALRAGTRAYR